MHGRRDGLVVVDVVIGVNRKRGHRQLLVREGRSEPLGAVEDGVFRRGGEHLDADGAVVMLIKPVGVYSCEIQSKV